MSFALKDFLLAPAQPRKGLLPIEWLTVGYVAFTSLLMLVFGGRMSNITGMLILRAAALCVVCLGWYLNKKFALQGIYMLRIACLVGLLAFWYPDLYEVSRIFPNADHVFASLEQSTFGCQPALLFSQSCTSRFLSECFYMGYLFYFPMIAILLVYYFFTRHSDFERTATILLGAFFTYYLVFLFLPVAGPQYYFNAIGPDTAAAGTFPAVGMWFDANTTMMDPPGWKDGLFYNLLEVIRHSERPVASFPSSHVGISTIVIFFAFKSRSKGLLSVLLPLWILLCCATVFIRAHYLVDVIAGFATAPLVFLLLNKIIPASSTLKVQS